MSFETRIKKRIDRVIKKATSNEVKDRIAKEAVQTIKRRTQSGFGVNNFGNNAKNKKLAKLTTKYINYRRKNKDKLANTTSPTKSNATFTGQMLNAITYTLTRLGFNLEIEDSSRTDSTLTNKEVAEYYQDTKRRKFFNVTKDEINIIRFEFLKEIRKIIKRTK